MNQPLVSVVIPCYNVEEYISECLSSVLDQTYSRIEIICVDDGSVDQTLEILKSHEQAHRGILQCIPGKHVGACGARNLGWRAAKGEWIQFLDADDLLMPDKIAHQLTCLMQVKEPVDLVVGGHEYETVTGERKTCIPDIVDPWINLSSTQLGNTCANLFRRAAVEAVGGWREGLNSSQEYDLMFRMLLNNEALIIDETPNTIVRERPGGSISQTNKIQNWRRYIALRQQMLQGLADQDKLTPERGHAIRQSMLNALRCLYDYSPEEAFILHKEVMPSNFRPTRSPYGILYEWFGFSIAQRFSRFLNP